MSRNPEQGVTHRSEVITYYKYTPVTNFDPNDELQRFGNVKIEATSFTISEPISSLEISPLIYELADKQEKEILTKNYEVSPFKIKTITLERIFVDKLFAAESYFRKSNDPHKAFEAAKHIYDLTILEKHNAIIALFENDNLLEYLVKYRPLKLN